MNEATLVAHYDFNDDPKKEDFLFKDMSTNSIQAHGSNVSYSIGSRHPDQNTLVLHDPRWSYFQSSGFVLLSTHDYAYSYTLWLNASTVSSFIPLVYLVDTSDSGKTSTCVNMLAINRTGKVKLATDSYPIKI